MHPEGDYQVNVECLVYGLSGGKGTEQMEVRFYVDENTRRSAYLYFTDATEDQSMQQLADLGWDGDTKEPKIDEKYYTEYCLPMRCEHEEYKGQMRERWRLPGLGGGKPAPDDVASRRAATFRSRFGKSKRPPPAGAPSTPPSSPPPADSSPPPEDNYGKDDAWNSVVDIAGDAGPNTQTWHSSVSAIGKREGDFTADDWRQVVANYAADDDIPF